MKLIWGILIATNPVFAATEGPYLLTDLECTEIITERVPQYIPYQQTYREMHNGFIRIQTRTNYKLQYHNVSRSQRTCCEGYRTVGFSLCQPICRFCENGVCVAPDTCRCHDGYTFSRTDKSTCIPFCEKPCINGSCTAPNTCTCEDKYELQWDTFTCKPICNTCYNFEFCAEPDLCRCLDQFNRPNGAMDRIASNDTIPYCVPICEEECVNSKCVAPNLCMCNPGYESFDPYTCLPKCSIPCGNGKCTAPETCTCNKGYTDNEGRNPRCIPLCSQTCIMGECIGPEVCSCFDGYSLQEGSSYICQPNCREPCINGSCTGPDTCSFKIEYENQRKSIYNPTCIKTCKIGNSTCLKGEATCTCEDGYSFIKESKHCEPICDMPCHNGKCLAPNACSCLDGYRPTSESRQHFATMCPILHKFNKECFQGYRLDHNESFPFCEPVCNTICVNGFCSAPNICTCYSGYELKNNTEEISNCIPICNCSYGYCDDTSSSCTRCETGYELMDIINSTICRPYCRSGCKYGNCTDPDNCTCNPNWAGKSCDKPLICTLKNPTEIENYQITENIISAYTNAIDAENSWNLPKCNDQCIDEIDNATKCINRTKIDGKNVTICFLKFDSKCNLLYALSNSRNLQSAKPITLIVSFISVILFVAVSVIVIILLVRKRRSKRLAMPLVQPQLQSQEGDYLIDNDGIYL